MNQTRLGSLIEALFNVLLGFGISFVANLIVLPRFGYAVSATDAAGIGLIFTLISIARSYLIRRFFNAQLHAAAQRLAGSTAQ